MTEDEFNQMRISLKDKISVIYGEIDEMDYNNYRDKKTVDFLTKLIQLYQTIDDDIIERFDEFITNYDDFVKYTNNKDKIDTMIDDPDGWKYLGDDTDYVNLMDFATSSDSDDDTLVTYTDRNQDIFGESDRYNDFMHNGNYSIHFNRTNKITNRRTKITNKHSENFDKVPESQNLMDILNVTAVNINFSNPLNSIGITKKNRYSLDEQDVENL